MSPNMFILWGKQITVWNKAGGEAAVRLLRLSRGGEDEDEKEEDGGEVMSCSPLSIVFLQSCDFSLEQTLLSVVCVEHWYANCTSALLAEPDPKLDQS